MSIANESVENKRH